MKVGIIGSGGREHAICEAIKKSKKIDEIYCFPGNAGTDLIATNVVLDFNDLSKSNCKAKRKFNKYHGLTLTKCFAASENNQKKIIKYLEGIL